MALDDPDLPELSTDEALLFISIWESHPCLWNPNDRAYKNKAEKAKALEAFKEEPLFTEWTPGMILRKMFSLKASFRKEKIRLASTTGRKRKKVWPLFQRINSFYGAVNCNNTDTFSDCPVQFMEYGTSADPDNSCADDIDILERQIGLIQAQAERGGNHGGDDGAVTSPQELQPGGQVTAQGRSHLPTGMVRNRRSFAAPPSSDALRLAQQEQFQATATSFLQQLMQEKKRKTDNVLVNFAVSVADDMSVIKNIKRLQMLKHEIRMLVHTAVLEDLKESGV